MSDPENCPGCGGDLGKTDNCRVCAYYAILDERPNLDELLAERRDMDLLGQDLEAYRACQQSGGSVRQWLNALSRRDDLVARSVAQAWANLASVIDRQAPDFLELLDRLAVAEYDVRVAERRRVEFWESVKHRLPQ